MANLIGKNVLIVDEVDDTRTTLEYAVKELQKDVETATQRLGRTTEKTRFSIFVLHNKDKEKKGHLPADMLDENRYLAAVTVPDVWINYPWEATYVIPVVVASEYTNGNLGTLMSTMLWRRSRKSNRNRLMKVGQW